MGDNRFKHPLAHAKQKFAMQRRHAKYRGIEFHLSFEEWYNWYLQQGVDRNIPQKNNGNAWCMCRKGDIGPYALDNIYLASNRQNVKDAYKNKRGGGRPKKLIQTPKGIFGLFETMKIFDLTNATLHKHCQDPNNTDFNYVI